MTEEEQIQSDIERFENNASAIPDDGDMVEQIPLFSSSDMQSVIENGKKNRLSIGCGVIFGGRTSLFSCSLTVVLVSLFLPHR